MLTSSSHLRLSNSSAGYKDGGMKSNAVWKNMIEVWVGRNTMTNELLCKICGRYLAVGCQCDSLKKQPCALCDQECADADALQKHMLRYH